MEARHARLRRLAAWVLFVWLFTLTTGIVNACVVTPQAMGGEAAMAIVSAMPSAPVGHKDGCGDCADDNTPSVSQGPCGKFCVDESSSVPSARRAFDPWPALAIAPVPTMALSVADPAPPAADIADSVPISLARVPIRIAYLRLTL